MIVTQLEIPAVLQIQLDRFADERGWFMEFWNGRHMTQPGLPAAFVQDNLAFSHRGVLRGLHFQEPNAQGKLVTVTGGEIYDVAVDLRPASETFGTWVAATLGEAQALYIPEGFAHGYQVLSESATVLYKCTRHYDAGAEHSLAWDDPALAIAWPIATPMLSARDRAAPSLAETCAALGWRPRLP